MAGILKRYQRTGSEFNIKDFGKGREEELANLLYKKALESDEILLKVKRRGVSVDPEKLTKFDNVVFPD